MGYRSDVTAVMYGAPDKVAAFIAAERLGENVFDFGELKGMFVLGEQRIDAPINGDFTGEGKAIWFEADQWKWYDSYESVSKFDSLLARAEEMGLEYEFVRIGEEDGDIERMSSDDSIGLLWVESVCRHEAELDGEKRL